MEPQFSSRRDPELREPIPNFFVSQLERALVLGVPMDRIATDLPSQLWDSRRRDAAAPDGGGLADMTDDDVSTGFGRGRRESGVVSEEEIPSEPSEESHGDGDPAHFGATTERDPNTVASLP